MGLGVLELLRTKTNATTATLVVSNDPFPFTRQRFRSGTGFAATQLSVCLLKLTPKKIAPTAIDEFCVNE
jgi:hypothetical protein